MLLRDNHVYANLLILVDTQDRAEIKTEDGRKKWTERKKKNKTVSRQLLIEGGGENDRKMTKE